MELTKSSTSNLQTCREVRPPCYSLVPIESVVPIGQKSNKEHTLYDSSAYSRRFVEAREEESHDPPIYRKTTEMLRNEQFDLFAMCLLLKVAAKVLSGCGLMLRHSNKRLGDLRFASAAPEVR